MRTTVENLYKNATYSQSEFFSLLILGSIVGFLFALENPVGAKSGVLVFTIQDVLLYIIATILILFLFTYIQKVVGVLVGVHASHGVSWTYLTITILLCIVSLGKLVIFIPPTLHIRQQEHLSIGRKPFAFSIKDLRMFALLPIMFLITLSIVLAQLFPMSPQVASALFWVSFLTVLYSLIPIEFIVNIPMIFAREKAEKFIPEKVVHKTETRGASLGSVLLYGSKMNWIFAFIFLVCSLISQVTTGIFFTLLFSFFVALAITTMFFIKTEVN